jgi:hypothetical protein
MPIEFSTRLEHILRDYQPFLVAAPWNLPHYDLCPFGLEIPPANVFNPLHMGSERFLHLLEKLDALTFGPEGMPMPRWVFYDGSELPGGIMGFARPAQQLSPKQRTTLGIDAGEGGLVPFSMYIAIPMLPKGDWMGHNLASFNSVFPEANLAGLSSLTKAFGLRVYRTRTLYGATQWDSHALSIHAKFGPLDLITAYTPAHSEPMTLTYRVPITGVGLRQASGDPTAVVVRPRIEFWLESDDVEQACRLQDEIEAGARYRIVDRPERRAQKLAVPLASGWSGPEET